MELSWSHALIPVKDMTNMLDFYTSILDFRIADRASRDGKEQIVFLSHLEEEHHQLAFYAAGTAFKSKLAGAHFAFRTQDLATVLQLHKRLDNDSRVADISPVTHGNTWSLYFMDPEQNNLEVFCDTPWAIRQPFSTTWDPSASTETIWESTYQAIKDRPDFTANIRWKHA